MSNVRWNLWVGYVNNSPYVLDVETLAAGPTQLYLVTSWPNDGSGLTQEEAASTADALRGAVAALPGVSAAVLTPLTVTGPYPVSFNPVATLSFDSAAYAYHQFQVTLPTQWGTDTGNVFLVSASPADGVLSEDDLGTVTSALVAHIKILPTVTDCTVARQAITPASA